MGETKVRRLFWWFLGLLSGFGLSLLAAHPANYVDRQWSRWFSCDERFIEIVRKSVEYQESNSWSDARLAAFGDEVETFTLLCGRVGGYDSHEALASIDRSLRRRGYEASTAMDRRYCFGEMISLMRTRESSWGEYLDLYGESLSVCTSD